jgi:flagellar hook-associated protein 1 FlgK
MSLLGLFDIGKSAVFASQIALNVVSNNIANINTPGYSRQEAILEVANPVQIKGDFIGRGVGDVEIRRHYDRFIHLQILGQSQSYGRSYALDQGLSHVEQIFNEAKDIGLLNPLNDYLNAWQEVATYPEGQPQRVTLLQKAEALVNTAKQMERDVLETLQNINDNIENIVSDINSILSNISTLNEKVAQLEAGLSREQSSYFRDERDKLLNELAELMDYTWYEDDNGYITILFKGKTLVNSEQAFEFSTQVDLNGDKNVIFSGQNMTSKFEKGQLGGFIDVRDDIKTNVLHSLRKLIASIVKETNILHRSGYGLDGSTDNNFFDDLQIYTQDYSSGGYITSASITDPSALTLDEYDIIFDTDTSYNVYNHQTGQLVTSGSYTPPGPAIISFEGIEVTIEGTPVTNDSFFISPLTGVIGDFGVAINDTQKIAAASSDLNLPGDNTKALEIAQLAQTEISNLDGATFENYYSSIVSTVGILSKAASDSLTYDDNLLYELQKKREDISGVSLDEEATNLLRYQRAFEAGAKILKVTDELLEVVINL